MLNFSTRKYIYVVVVLEAVLIFQAEKDVTEEILAEGRRRCRVRWHGTTGRKCLRSYRVIVPHRRRASKRRKINRRFNDHRLDRERRRERVNETRYDRTQVSAVVPGGRTVPPKFVQKVED